TTLFAAHFGSGKVMSLTSLSAHDWTDKTVLSNRGEAARSQEPFQKSSRVSGAVSLLKRLLTPGACMKARTDTRRLHRLHGPSQSSTSKLGTRENSATL